MPGAGGLKNYNGQAVGGNTAAGNRAAAEHRIIKLYTLKHHNVFFIIQNSFFCFRLLPDL